MSSLVVAALAPGLGAAIPVTLAFLSVCAVAITYGTSRRTTPAARGTLVLERTASPVTASPAGTADIYPTARDTWLDLSPRRAGDAPAQTTRSRRARIPAGLEARVDKVVDRHADRAFTSERPPSSRPGSRATHRRSRTTVRVKSR